MVEDSIKKSVVVPSQVNTLSHIGKLVAVSMEKWMEGTSSAGGLLSSPSLLGASSPSWVALSSIRGGG